ncbi:MAG: sensor domain-containing diguanylate cyclase [Deltaproteobacteria bacterium]|nr:sensor domain-containing diguanylate cyclase [Deltaproteobacteria bacterium]
MRINIAQQSIIDKILERDILKTFKAEKVDLRAMLKEILLWANKFVPSESGSVLLDDPTFSCKEKENAKGTPLCGVLYFVACFGKGSSALADTALPVNVGIVGQTYQSGKPYISKTVKEDSRFYSGIDRKTKFRTKSIVCAPIRLKGQTIGVIELINRLNGIAYTKNDLTLLKIFAEYTSTLVQNSLDAKMFAELSMSDNLTGLFNDRYFYSRLAKEALTARKHGGDLSLVFLDLDRFKEVNDKHGHLAGSMVLTEVGRIIRGTLPRESSKAARFGGDEFVVILPGLNLEKSSEYAEKLRRSVEDYTFLRHALYRGAKPIMLSGHITISIGVASLRANVKPVGSVNEVRDALIRQSDTAMYKSKENGKNRYTAAEGKIDPTEATGKKDS